MIEIFLSKIFNQGAQPIFDFLNISEEISEDQGAQHIFDFLNISEEISEDQGAQLVFFKPKRNHIACAKKPEKPRKMQNPGETAFPEADISDYPPKTIDFLWLFV